MPSRSKVPLPVEPAPPVLAAQDAIAQGAADLEATGLWRYRLRYWHEHAAQDEVVITASFNIPSSDETTIAAEAAPPLIEDRLIAQLIYSDDGKQLEALRLTRDIDEPGAVRRWPHIDYHSSAEPVIDLGNGAGEGPVRTYAFDPPMIYEGWSHTIDLIWDDLAVTHAQNARAALSALRNRGLVAEGAATDVVVYRTATVETSDLVTPHNRWPQDFDISALGDKVEIALDAVFCILFGDHRVGQQVMMELSYGYPLLPHAKPDEVLVTMPVAMVPRQSITTTTAAQIAAMLAAWKDENEPTTGGQWLFSLALFSQIDTRAVSPLLELNRLVYRLR